MQAFFFFHASTRTYKAQDRSIAPAPYRPLFPCRGNQLDVAGWAEVADALEHITSLTSLNDCTDYAAIRKGGLKEMELDLTELGVWAARFFEKSAKTLTLLDVR